MLKLKKIVLTLLLATSFAIPASAYNMSLDDYQKGNIVLPAMEVEAGFDVSHILYREPGVMSEEGEMFGVFAELTARDVDPDAVSHLVFFRLDGKISAGEVDYDGSGEIKDIDDTMIEVRGVVGRDFPVSDSVLFSPYIGLGYRYLFDDLGVRVSSSGALGYDRTSQYYYAPIGADLGYHFANGWVVTLNGEFDWFIRGEQRSELDQIGLAELKNDQEDGWGARASLKIEKESESIDFYVEPYIRYWDIDDSEVATFIVPVGSNTFLQFAGFEPANDSTEVGIKVGIGF